MHRNNPCPITGLSPAQIVFGRAVRDPLPLQPSKLHLRQDWRQAADARAEAYSSRKFTMQDKLSRGAKLLHSLKVRDHVLIQDEAREQSQAVEQNWRRDRGRALRQLPGQLIKPVKPNAQISEAFQTTPRLRPGQSSSPPGTSSTTLPVILPPPRAPEPELPSQSPRARVTCSGTASLPTASEQFHADLSLALNLAKLKSTLPGGGTSTDSQLDSTLQL